MEIAMHTNKRIIDDVSERKMTWHLFKDSLWEHHWLVKLARETPGEKVWDEFEEGDYIYRGYVIFYKETKTLESWGHTRCVGCPLIHITYHQCPVCGAKG